MLISSDLIGKLCYLNYTNVLVKAYKHLFSSCVKIRSVFEKFDLLIDDKTLYIWDRNCKLNLERG